MPRRLAQQTVRGLGPAIVATDEVMARTGFAARPVQPREMEWLLHRSVSLGLPAPLTLGAVDGPDWEPDDLGEFTRHLAWVLLNRHLRERLGEAARAHAARFTWPQSVAAFAAVLDAATAPQGDRVPAGEEPAAGRATA